MEREEKNYLRILMFPWLAHGHIYPFYELAKRLSRRNFKTYICSSSVNLTSIQHLSESHQSFPSIEFVQLQIPSSPELPPELHTTKNLPSQKIPSLIQIFQESDSSFSQILTCIQPDLLIYDAFQPWAAKLALSMGIPSVYFSITGAASMSYFHHLHTYDGNKPGYPFPAIYVPDSAVKFQPFPPIKGAEEGFIFGNLKLSSDTVLISSYRQLEAKYIDYLSFLTKKRVVPTGPLIAEANVHDQIKLSEIMTWLSGKPQFSTLYISFGSECFLSKEQLHELAEGLEVSGANFLWVIRFSALEKGTSLETALPQGFLQRTNCRGMVVLDWAPQTRILAHQSIGAFVSHCGWNSLTESLYFGVPIIAMPMKFEQPVSAKMLVEAGVAVEVERREDGIYRGESIANAINEVIVEKKIYHALKNKASELSKGIRENEEAEANAVADELQKICIKNKCV